MVLARVARCANADWRRDAARGSGLQTARNVRSVTSELSGLWRMVVLVSLSGLEVVWLT